MRQLSKLEQALVSNLFFDFFSQEQMLTYEGY